MTDFTLRAHRPDDIAAIAELFNQPRVIDGTLRFPFTPEAGLDEWLGSMGTNKRMIIADSGGSAIGFIILQRFEGRMAHSGDIFIAVHDDFHGHGIGRALMAAALDVADNWMGLVRLQLEVLVDNTDAVRLYEQMGFKREGRARAGTIRCGELVDHFYMARLIDPPARRDEDVEENP